MIADVITKTALAVINLEAGECKNDLSALRFALALCMPDALAAYDRAVNAEMNNPFFNTGMMNQVTFSEADGARRSIIQAMKRTTSGRDSLLLMSAAETVMEMSAS